MTSHLELRTDEKIKNDITIFRRKREKVLTSQSYSSLAEKIRRREAHGLFIQHSHLLDSQIRREVIDLNQLVMYNVLYLKVRHQANRLVKIRSYKRTLSKHGPINVAEFEETRREFLENIVQQVIVAELFKWTIENLPDRVMKTKEFKIQGFVNKILEQLDNRVFEMIYMMEKDRHQIIITRLSGIISKYFYLSDLIEGMGIPLFEVIENAQKENQKAALKVLYPRKETSIQILSDPEIRKLVQEKLKVMNILVRCTWTIEKKYMNGSLYYVIRIQVNNRGPLSPEMQKIIQSKFNVDIKDKSINDFFKSYSEESLSAGIGLPMLNFLMEEFQQKGIEVKFSIYNAVIGSDIITEMFFMI